MAQGDSPPTGAADGHRTARTLPWAKIAVGVGTALGLLSGILVIPGQVNSAWNAVFGGDDTRIALVDTTVVDEEGKFPRLDITVRNPSKGTVVIKRTEFEIIRIWRIRPRALASTIPTSATYDVMFRIRDPNTEVRSYAVTVSQEIKPGEADKFAFLLGSDGSEHGEEYIVLMRATLVYNENNRKQRTNNVIYMVRYPSLASRLVPGTYLHCMYDANRDHVAEITRLYASDQSTVKNQRLTDFLATPKTVTCA